jgi:hypothetical protein
VSSHSDEAMTLMWAWEVWGLLPEYRTHCHGENCGRLSMISPLAITYLMRLSREAWSSSVNRSMSNPASGSWVTSRAVTMPGPYHGEWSLVTSWLASPMVPSDALFLLGNLALIWSRRVSRELATRQANVFSSC